MSPGGAERVGSVSRVVGLVTSAEDVSTRLLLPLQGRTRGVQHVGNMLLTAWVWQLRANRITAGSALAPVLESSQSFITCLRTWPDLEELQVRPCPPDG